MRLDSHKSQMHTSCSLNASKVKGICAEDVTSEDSAVA